MESSQIEKTIVEQVVDLLQRNGKNHDVTFSVGPDKIKVGAVRILLKAASVVFEQEFDENWECAVVKEGEGIPLLDVDPVVFKIFVNLIISDSWSLDALKKLNLAPDTLLSLLGLCRRFKITKAIKNLEAAADYIVQWAEHQCSEKKIEPTGENFREVLGSAFFQIRFPTMKANFAKVRDFKKNLFTPEERLAICEFIILDEDDRANYDKTQLPFNANPRNSLGCSALRLSEFEHFKVTTNPLFVCGGSETYSHFQVDQKIALHGVGFLGPIGGDTQYEVTLRIQRLVNGAWAFKSSTFKKQIVARKDRIFHFLLDEPITIEPNSYDSTWFNLYRIFYSLKGTSNVPKYNVDDLYETSVQNSGVTFNLRVFHNGKPVTELLYKMQ